MVRESADILNERLMAIIVNLDAIAKITSKKSEGKKKNLIDSIDGILNNTAAFEREYGVIDGRRTLYDFLAECKRELKEWDVRMKEIDVECSKIQNMIIRTNERNADY